MSGNGGLVTLIFYKSNNPLREPFLNNVAMLFQMSAFTHVEVAIGEEAGDLGQMSNVLRIFNDNVGVELTSRTGRNPQYSYLSIGCSKGAEQAMLAYSRTLVGRPFSNIGMMRSIFFPRKTDCKSFFCAELVATVLQKGGLMSRDSNPGSATPASLHKLYKNQAAVTANPYTLRQFNMAGPKGISATPMSIGLGAILKGGSAPARYSSREQRAGGKIGDSSSRAAFKCVTTGRGYNADTARLLS